MLKSVLTALALVVVPVAAYAMATEVSAPEINGPAGVAAVAALAFLALRAYDSRRK